MTISLLTAYTPDIEPWAAPIAEDKRRYCAHHGYAFECAYHFDPSRHPTWSKILFLQGALSRSDWLFWTDADTELTAPDQRLETFLDVGPEIEIVIGEDHNGINNGNAFFRCSDWMRAFLRECWESWELVDHPWAEQAAMMSLLPKYRERFAIVPGLMVTPEDWKPGDFLRHWAGPDRKRKLADRVAALVRSLD